MPTYKENYQEFVEEKISGGGGLVLIEHCVAEFNALESPDYKPGHMYSVWIHGTEHRCSSCEKMFQLPEADLGPAPSSEILCLTCMKNRTHQEAAKLPPEDTQEDDGDALLE